jgi:hypothetical protein
MLTITRNHTYIKYAVVSIWICNCILASIIAIQQSWLPYMNAGGIPYGNIHADPFDGMMMPIRYIPDWSKTQYQNKTTRFNEIPVSDYLPLPAYDPIRLADMTDPSRASLIMHYTYITGYMGSYRLNYKEHDGSHNGIDIRAPIGTPVLAIANGVVVRTVESDAVGTKFVVIRHDGINIG